MGKISRWVVSTDGRRWLFRVVGAVVALLAVYGLVGDEAAPLWLTLGAAVLGVGGVGAVAATRRRRRRRDLALGRTSDR